jgi:arylsulfatase A-like enzyme
MKREVDRPISQLVLDLEERGLLSRTLIVIASEFGRDMMMEGRPERFVGECNSIQQPDVMTDTKHYGMHRHFTAGSSVVLFGGGMKKGFLYGRTAEERPLSVTDKPVSVEDLHATIFRALGIPHDLAYEVEKRPVYVTKDGKGRPIADLFG